MITTIAAMALLTPAQVAILPEQIQPSVLSASTEKTSSKNPNAPTRVATLCYNGGNAFKDDETTVF